MLEVLEVFVLDVLVCLEEICRSSMRFVHQRMDRFESCVNPHSSPIPRLCADVDVHADTNPHVELMQSSEIPA